MLRLRFHPSPILFRPPQHRLRTLATGIPPIRHEYKDALGTLIGPQTTEDDIPATPPTSQEYSQPETKALNHHELPSSLASDNSFQLYIKASSNNTIITFSTPTGRVLSVVSAGMCGFKKVQRSTYEAGYRCAVHMFQKIAEVSQDNLGMTLQVNFKGFGQGREAAYRALTTTEGDTIRTLVKCISDRTPIKIGGTKAKKTRRL